MNRIDAELSARFERWERRGRGWQIYPQPVAPEPAFAPFPGHYLRNNRALDDGRQPTVVSSLFGGLWHRTAPPLPPEEDDEPEATLLLREPAIELPLYLPPSFNAKPLDFEAFVRSLTLCREPIAFELIGTPLHVTAQLATSAADEAHVRQQLRAFFPEIVCVPSAGALDAAWADSGSVVCSVDFALGKECLLPLATVSHDLSVPLIGALSALSVSEMAVYQVLFQPTTHPWAENLVRAVTGPDEKPFFVNAPELADAARNKATRPLFGVIVRMMACAASFERLLEILRALASPLRAFGHPNGNDLIPLRNDSYSLELHAEDVLLRQTHRGGMLLNADELFGFIRFPTSAVRSIKFRRQTRKTKPAPDIAMSDIGLMLGTNEHAGNTRAVRLTPEQRTRHTHIIGAWGTGKSTLLLNLIRQDIENGQGLAVLDPHGDLIDQILGIIPSNRIDDVVFLDPADETYSVGFNILSATSDLEKTLLSSDLVSVFQRLSSSWGDQMESVLRNAILAFLESSEGGTLADLQRFLLDDAFQAKFLMTVRDPDVVYYWKKVFAKLPGNKSIGPVLTRLDSFLSPKPIRYMVSQKVNRLDFPAILDTGKIFLAKLSQGAIGNENAYLLGSLLMAKFQQTAMSRQRQAQAARRDFWLYLDEFQNFITASLAEILTGARKYRLGLILAHQELRHLQRNAEVASAVFNTGTRICFRLGDQDAREMERGFSSFDARDLQNLSAGEAICRVERSDFDFNLSVPLPEFPSESERADTRLKVVAASREKYGTPRAEIEALLSAAHSVDARPPPSAKPEVFVAPAPVPVVPAPQPPALDPVSTPPAKPRVSPPLAAILAAPMPQSPVLDLFPTPLVKPVPDLGRGGAQHKAVQLRVKEAAESLNFRVHVEKLVLDGAGCVDLVIERDGFSLACEISVTATIDYEIGNVAKCAKAGFREIAIVAINGDKLSKLEAAVTNSLGPELARLVRYFLPDALIAYLKALPAASLPTIGERKSHGYRVTKSFVAVSPDEARARENAIIKMIAESLKRPKKLAD